MYSALTIAHTLAKSSQMEDFLTQYVLGSYKRTYTSKILTNERFPHPVRFYVLGSFKCTYTIVKSSQMENFLTQYDSMYSALTNAHTLAKSSQMDD